jgi:hypothetical protein
MVVSDRSPSAIIPPGRSKPSGVVEPFAVRPLLVAHAGIWTGRSTTKSTPQRDTRSGQHLPRHPKQAVRPDILKASREDEIICRDPVTAQATSLPPELVTATHALLRMAVT